MINSIQNICLKKFVDEEPFCVRLLSYKLGLTLENINVGYNTHS